MLLLKRLFQWLSKLLSRPTIEDAPVYVNNFFCVPFARLTAGIELLEILIETELATSRADARRLIQQGGVFVNELVVDRSTGILTPKNEKDGGILLRVGKEKRKVLIFVEES